MSSVAWFKDVGIADRPTVGGKGGSLGELTGAGIAVPPGFVVTVHGFELFLEAIEARAPVRSKVEALGPNGEPVAVRSSATTEDAEDASFAGLQDTFLWVLGADQMVAKVRECWGSLYSVESMTYRL